MIAIHSRTSGTADLPHGYWITKVLSLFNHRIEYIPYFSY